MADVEGDSVSSTTSEHLSQLEEENASVKDSATSEALRKVEAENEKLLRAEEDSVSPTTSEHLSQLEEENASVKDSATSEALRKVEAENEKLLRAVEKDSVSSTTSEHLSQLEEENASLKDSATSEALRKVEAENEKLRRAAEEDSVSSTTSERLRQLEEEKASLKDSATSEALRKVEAEDERLDRAAEEDSLSSATSERLRQLEEENARLKDSATREALRKAEEENERLRLAAMRDRLRQLEEENARLKDSATREALRKAEEENERLRRAGTTSFTRDALKRAEEENEKLRSAATTSVTRKRLAELKVENAKMRDEETTSKTREALKKLEADNVTLRVRKRKKDIAVILEHYNQIQMVDLCFLVDSTGSMGTCIDNVKNKIKSIVNQVGMVYPDLKVRYAFVGYRDIEDGSQRFSVFNFSDQISQFEPFVGDVAATGGADQCEDIFGGIQEALNLSWNFKTRIIIHFADAPCHGSEFHDGCGDSYPGGDPNGLSIDSLLQGMLSKGIQYWFVHLNDTTTKMINVFNTKTALEINELDMSGGFDSMVKSLSTSICESILTVDKASRPRGGRHVVFSDLSAVSEASVDSLLDFHLVSEYPRSFKTFTAIIYKVRYPRRCSDLHRPFLFEPGTSVNIKIAAHPFAEGASRIAYYGQDSSDRKIVLKEFKDTSKNILKNYMELVETSAVSYYLSQQFNKKIEGVGKGVSFIVPQLIEIKDPTVTPSKSTTYFWIEPQIEGEYKKFNSNFGYVSDENYHQTLLAFSHWTYNFTGGYMMVVDLQGVIDGSDFRLTDPAIHCEDPTDSSGLERFGNTNLGKSGFKRFFDTHSCNKVCCSLALPRVGGRKMSSIATSTMI